MVQELGLEIPKSASPPYNPEWAAARLGRVRRGPGPARRARRRGRPRGEHVGARASTRSRSSTSPSPWTTGLRSTTWSHGCAGRVTTPTRVTSGTRRAPVRAWPRHRSEPCTSTWSGREVRPGSTTSAFRAAAATIRTPGSATSPRSAGWPAQFPHDRRDTPGPRAAIIEELLGADGRAAVSAPQLIRPLSWGDRPTPGREHGHLPAGTRHRAGQDEQGARRGREARRDARPLLREDARADHPGAAGPGRPRRLEEAPRAPGGAVPAHRRPPAGPGQAGPRGEPGGPGQGGAVAQGGGPAADRRDGAAAPAARRGGAEAHHRPSTSCRSG